MGSESDAGQFSQRVGEDVWLCSIINGITYIYLRSVSMCWLYTIHGFVGGECFPLVFGLLPNKLGATYNNMFGVVVREMIRLGLNVNIPNANVDNETAPIAAIRTAFPHTLVRTCLFHYAKDLNANRDRLGLATAYRQGGASFSFNFKRWFRQLIALPLVPAQHIQEAIQRVLSRAPAMEPKMSECLHGNPTANPPTSGFVQYYVAQWVGKAALWNHHDNAGTMLNWHTIARNVRRELQINGMHRHHPGTLHASGWLDANGSLDALPFLRERRGSNLCHLSVKVYYTIVSIRVLEPQTMWKGGTTGCATPSSMCPTPN